VDHVPLAALASGRAPASADSRAMMNRPLSVMNLDLTEEESAALLRPAVIGEGQLHPSKPTNPPARSFVCSVPSTDIRATPERPARSCAVEQFMQSDGSLASGIDAASNPDLLSREEESDSGTVSYS